MKTDGSILILYDGNCPLCCRKRDFLMRKDKQDKLRFSDIRSTSFNADKFGVSYDILEKQIHAVLKDGSVVSRMDVIRAAYRELGMGWLIAPTGWPVLRYIFDLVYGLVAKNRLAISRLLR